MEFGRVLTASAPALPLSHRAAARISAPSARSMRLAPIRAQAPEAEKQPGSVQKVSLEQSSAPSAEMQSNIAAQDKAPQQEVLSDNLQTGAEVVQFEVFGQTQEAINGRAAMVGFVAAVFAELTTQQSVWSQIAGKTTANGKVLEHGWQFAPLGFGAVVALLTYASIAPQFQAGEKPDSRSVGPFTPFAEKWNGRLAMLGFSGLLLVEIIKGNSPLF
ncbi:g12749 [Coccomyxa viridis]|uniref:G12749 protein n=1 Tax=Coccomyxa viridis TaxID=1274662 RepID=A0ABP1GDS1_9CHLO